MSRSEPEAPHSVPLLLRLVSPVDTGASFDFQRVSDHGLANIVRTEQFPSSPKPGSGHDSSFPTSLRFSNESLGGKARVSLSGQTTFYTALTLGDVCLDVDKPLVHAVAGPEPVTEPVTSKPAAYRAVKLKDYQSFSKRLPPGIIKYGRFLGEGGNGSVHAARATGSKRKLALKLGRAHVLADELEVLQYLGDVPDSVPVLAMTAAFSLDGRPCIAFQRLSGDLYTNVLERSGYRPLCHSSVQKIMQQTFEGLAHLHDIGITHADIKADNILLYNSRYKIIKTKAGLRCKLLNARLKLGDLGAAVIGSGSTKPVGTDQFLPPERIIGLAWDPKSDMFQAGCLLMELLTGKSPLNPVNSGDVGERLVSMLSLLGRRTLPRTFAKSVADADSTLVGPGRSVRWPLCWTQATAEARRRMRRTGSIDQVIPYGKCNNPNRHFNSLLKKLLKLNASARISAAAALNHSSMHFDMSDS